MRTKVPCFFKALKYYTVIENNLAVKHPRWGQDMLVGSLFACPRQDLQRWNDTGFEILILSTQVFRALQNKPNGGRIEVKGIHHNTRGRFKTRRLGRGFHTLIRNALFPSSTDVGSHNPPLRSLASSLAHRLVPDSNTICNSPSPPLVDIVLFEFSLLGFLSKF